MFTLFVYRYQHQHQAAKAPAHDRNAYWLTCLFPAKHDEKWCNDVGKTPTLIGDEKSENIMHPEHVCYKWTASGYSDVIYPVAERNRI